MTSTVLHPPANRPDLARSEAVEAIIRLALQEDVGRGDLTTEATVAVRQLSTKLGA